MLSEEQVRKIYAAADTYEVLASQFGVARGTISDIKRRKTWKHLDLKDRPLGGNRKLTEDQVRDIHISPGTQGELAERFGVTRLTISNIKQGLTWQHLNLGARPPAIPRLTEVEVRAIYESRESCDDLAYRYKVSRATIFQIKSRRGWSHLDFGDLLPGICPKGKLTEIQVRLIYASGATTKELANKYGVSKVSILNIKARRSWKHLDLGNPSPNACGKLTEDQVRDIYAARDKHQVLAERYGISRLTVSNIKLRRTWRSLDFGDLLPGTWKLRKKVTEEEYELILKSDRNEDELASQFGISGWLVDRIKRQVPWEHLGTGSVMG